MNAERYLTAPASYPTVVPRESREGRNEKSERGSYVPNKSDQVLPEHFYAAGTAIAPALQGKRSKPYCIFYTIIKPYSFSNSDTEWKSLRFIFCAEQSRIPDFSHQHADVPPAPSFSSAKMAETATPLPIILAGKAEPVAEAAILSMLPELEGK